MSFINRLKVGTKLLSAFSILLVLMALMGGLAVWKMADLNTNCTELATNWMPATNTANDLNTLVADFRIKEFRHLAADNPDEVAAAERDMDEIRTNADKLVDTLQGMASSPEEQKVLAELSKVWDDYLVQNEKIVALSREGKKEDGEDLLQGTSFQLYEKVGELLDKEVDINSVGGDGEIKSALEAYTLGRNTTLGVLGLNIVLGLALSFTIARAITGPLNQAVTVLKQVAEGDLTARLNVTNRDEVGQMADSLNQAVDSMQEALSEVRSVADNVASASQQLAAASQQISTGAQEQASSLEETASSLEEITATIRQNADNADQANQLSARSREVAEKGGKVVGDAVTGMQEINAASKRIADIITAIDEIAFQTNLLALNAAVEAARAGEQGRGFAVVAGEVRNLAQRSAGAAKEIKGLIQDSVRKVEVGTNLVNQSGETLSEIISSVKRVTDIVAEISAASREQATGIEQVNRAVSQMDQVTQENASQTEELSGTAEGLSGQAEGLQQLVRKFTLDTAKTKSHAPSASPLPTSKAPLKRLPKSPVGATGKIPSSPPVRATKPAPQPELELAAAGAPAHGQDGFVEF
jgi:methyl-accepting chemotaxis protein